MQTTIDTSQLRGVDLVALIERDGVTLRGQSERYGACPKCGGVDRFHLRSYNGCDYFFCRQCHEKRGDAIEYLRWLHGMTFRQACDALGLIGHSPTPLPKAKPQPKTATGIVIPNCLDEPPDDAWQVAMREFVTGCAANLPNQVREYLHGRGLNDETIARYHIGYNTESQRIGGQWWTWRGIVIPTTYGGHLWRVNVRRRSDDLADGRGKYMAATGSRAQLFNGDALAASPHTVIVCAGEFDAMLTQQHAPEGVACITYGSESKGISWETDYLLRGKRVLIAYDNDSAGDAGAQQWAKIGTRVRVPSGKDITEFWQAGGNVTDWIASLAQPADKPVVVSPEPENDTPARRAAIVRFLERTPAKPSAVGAHILARFQVSEDVFVEDVRDLVRAAIVRQCPDKMLELSRE